MTEARPPHAGQETNSPYEFNANETYNEVIYSENWKRLRSKDYFDYRHDWGSDTARETRVPIHHNIETPNICNL
jgi:hypothetical protein